MIDVIKYNNLGIYSDLYVDQFRLRHKEFIERQRYDVKVYEGMEFDEYDTPASIYLVYSDDRKRVLGVSRLMPTTVGCMIAEHWPHIISNSADLVSSDIWEGTRFCVDSSLPPIIRRKIAEELCFAYVELGIFLGAKKIVGVMQSLVLRSVFGRSGISYETIGKSSQIGRHSKVQVASMDVNYNQLINLRKATGLSSVIRTNINIQEEKDYRNAA